MFSQKTSKKLFVTNFGILAETLMPNLREQK